MNARKTTLFTMLFAAGFAGLAAADAATTPVVASGVLYLKGDSTLHSFASTTTAVQASAEIAPAAGGGEDTLAAALKDGRVRTLEAVIPVTTLKSGEKGLDKNLYAALKADAFPQVVYRIDSFERADPAGDAPRVRAHGRLTICGQERPAVIDAQALPSGGSVRFAGSYRLLMSDFGVKPPTFMMGALKVRDPVTVYFDLTFGLKP